MKVFEIDGNNTLSVSLYTDVTNSKELLDLMQAGTLQPEVAFLNASLIPDIFPVLAAAHKTLVAKARDSLTTRTPHSELVYNYSGSKHITESLKRCGISDSTTYILSARFNASPEEVEAIGKLVHGKELSLDELGSRANHASWEQRLNSSYPMGDPVVFPLSMDDDYQVWQRQRTHPYLLRGSAEQMVYQPPYRDRYLRSYALAPSHKLKFLPQGC